MFEQIKQLIQFRGRSTSGGDISTTPRSEVSDETGASQDQQPSSRLFRCPSCDTVYIAHSKEMCESCDTTVTQISATPYNQSNGNPGQYLVEEW